MPAMDVQLLSSVKLPCNHIILIQMVVHRYALVA